MTITDTGDPFKDLMFNGAPSKYRLFGRKILLQIPALEEKYVRLAGPRILSRLTGEAGKVTEHLQILELTLEECWLRVFWALDQHYRFLPETELNECRRVLPWFSATSSCSTGRYCRFKDVERVLRASDFEGRRYMAAENASDTMLEPRLKASSAEAHELDKDSMTEDDEVRENLEEAFEIQMRRGGLPVGVHISPDDYVLKTLAGRPGDATY